MSDHRLVECEQHGSVPAAYVCQHLLQSLQDDTPRGVQWVKDEDGCVNAWCDTCEAYLGAHGSEWNDKTEAHAGIQLVCHNCFLKLETFNEMKDLN